MKVESGMHLLCWHFTFLEAKRRLSSYITKISTILTDVLQTKHQFNFGDTKHYGCSNNIIIKNFALNEKVSPEYYHSYFNDYFIIIKLRNKNWELKVKLKLWSWNVFLNLWHVQHFSEIVANAYRVNETAACPKDFLYIFSYEGKGIPQK